MQGVDEDERQWGSEWHQCVCVFVCGLTTWSFVLHLYLFLKSASHGLHLTWAAVRVPIAAANRVLVLRTRVWAFTHCFAVLHHAHGSKLAGLLQTGALQVKICPKMQRNKLSFDIEKERKRRGGSVVQFVVSVVLNLYSVQADSGYLSEWSLNPTQLNSLSPCSSFIHALLWLSLYQTLQELEWLHFFIHTNMYLYQTLPGSHMVQNVMNSPLYLKAFFTPITTAVCVW